jgi:hypothetical protein
MEKESNKQTAVEWVLQYLNNVKPNEFCSIEKIKELLEQAKQMEKEQIIDACNYGDFLELGEQYYAKTYGGKDEQ